MSEKIKNNLYYPPGGILIWILIFVELLTFGMALIVLVYLSREDINLFHASRLKLNTNFGAINTIFLLTSGFFMASTVQQFKKNDLDKAKLYLILTILGGGLFLLLKTVEYYQKIELGLGLDHNTFFTFYWLLTGFHIVHVLVGLVILTYFLFKLKKTKKIDLEAGATFWHMCDLIWLMIFPVIYLIL